LNTKNFLDCNLLDVKVYDSNENYFTFEGYASTFGNKDRGSDVVVKGCFRESIQELTKGARPIPNTDYVKLMPVLWQHDWNNPIGSFVEMREDEKGLFVKGIMPKDDDFVRGRVIPQMKAGSVSDMSIGYIINDDRYDRDEEIRYIEKAQLFETSLVTIPMNEQAHITAMKSAVVYQDLPIADKETEWNYDEAQKRHTENGVDEKSYLIIKKKDSVVEYLLPIADFVEGELMVIPKAVFSTALQIHNGDATKGMDDKDIGELKSNIDKYYKSMGLESPYKDNAFRLDDAKAYTERELETLLKSGVCFSQKTAKALLKTLLDDSHRDDELKSQRDAVLKDKLEKLLKTLT